MNRKICVKKILLILIIITGLSFVFSAKVKAASLGLSASRANVTVGDSVTVTVTGNGLTGRVNLSANGGSISPSSVWVEGGSATATVSTSNAGNITISANGLLSDDEGNETNYSKSCSITVNEKQAATTSNKTTSSTKSTTTNKKATNNAVATEKPVNDETATAQLGIVSLEIYSINENNEKVLINLDKAFDINTFDYICNVGSNIQKIDIVADAKEYNDILTISGADKELVEGENTVTLTLIKDEKNITYTIKINKDKKEEVQVAEEHTQPIKENFLNTKIILPIWGFAIIQMAIIMLEAGMFFGVKYIIKHKKGKNN